MASPQWQSFDPNARRTLRVLKTIQKKYGNFVYDDVIMAIGVLNEPLGPALNTDQLRQFHYDAFYQQRDYSSKRVVVLSDAFYAPSSYNGMLTPSDNNAQNVALDHHQYQVFTPEQTQMTVQQHIQAACSNGGYAGSDKWLMIGEWSGAFTDCAKWLNGYGVGARFDNTYTTPTKYVGTCSNKNNYSKWSTTRKNNMRKFIEA